MMYQQWGGGEIRVEGSEKGGNKMDQVFGCSVQLRRSIEMKYTRK
jgi:hypothetical protein